MIVALVILLLLAAAYVFMLRGRTGHPGLAALRGFSYAHRGLHSPGVPENSLAAFRAAVANGYGSELDVHLMADGTLAVIHDASLKRTAGADVQIEKLTRQDLACYFLEGTAETIPTLQEVLQVYGGKAPLIVELKPVGGNIDALCRAVCDTLAGYDGVYCLESFDPRCVAWLKKHRPELIRGQLSENFLKTGKHMSWILRFLMTFQLPNLLSTPDFVAYKYADRKNISVFISRKLWKLQGVSWTLKTPEEYETAVKEGYIPIFENFRP